MSEDDMKNLFHRTPSQFRHNMQTASGKKMLQLQSMSSMQRFSDLQHYPL